VSRELRTLNAISRAYPEFWTANPEMMCIALMSDPGVVSSSQGKGKQRAGEARKWGKARLGQSVLFLELIALARKLNKDRKDDNSVSFSFFGLCYRVHDGVFQTPAPMLLQAINFFVALEIRVAVLLEAKVIFGLFYFVCQTYSDETSSRNSMPSVHSPHDCSLRHFSWRFAS